MKVHVFLWVVLSRGWSMPPELQRPVGHRHDCLLGELGCAVSGAQRLWSSWLALPLTDAGETSSPAQACLQEGLMAANRHRKQKGCWWAPGAWGQADSTLPRECLKGLPSLLLASASSPTARLGQAAGDSGRKGCWGFLHLRGTYNQVVFLLETAGLTQHHSEMLISQQPVMLFP